MPLGYCGFAFTTGTERKELQAHKNTLVVGANNGGRVSPYSQDGGDLDGLSSPSHASYRLKAGFCHLLQPLAKRKP